jgi:branched-chain amino acid aminotransferase
MADSARRICMPAFPEDRFVDAVKQVVQANAAWVPPFGSGATLYVRPYMIATGNVIGVKPATEYQFRILVTPVGPYYSGGVKPVALKVSEYDRAAPHGTGNIKAGLNYAMSLYPSVEAHAEGFADNMYLDPATRSFVEESGGANFLFVDAEGSIVVPQSATDSILPSITRRSLVTVARDLLGMKVVERPVRFDEIAQFNECGMCGTAAVISPVSKVVDVDGSEIVFGAGMEHVGPVLAKLRETLTAIQAGELEGPEGWVVEIC